MRTTYTERMAKLPKSEDLGTYVAETDRIKAELKLRTDLRFIAVTDFGSDWYSGVDCYTADVKFFTDIQYEGDSEGFSVTAHYSSIVLGEIFVIMKTAEEGVEQILRSGREQLLRSGRPYNDDWRKTCEVMKCIFSLEDQTKHLYAEREEALEQRRLIIYGR